MDRAAHAELESFADRLDRAVREKRSVCLLGLDPHLALLPDEFSVARDVDASRAERAAAVARFCTDLIDLAHGDVPAVKLQSAFFELLGADGVRAWEQVIVHARAAGLIVIGDVKRGDVASTASAYASAHLEGPDGRKDARACDAVTINPLLGADSVRPFLDVCHRSGAGIYVLVQTSNPGFADFQLHGDPPLARRIAQAVDAWGSELVGSSGLSSVGAVVGATHPQALHALRRELPRTPFLVPGFGAQGAGASDVAGAFLPGGRGALIASSRAIAFAFREPRYAGRSWRAAARAALTETVAALRAISSD